MLYYSAIFPFQKYAVNMLQCNLTLTEPSQDSFWAGSSVTIIQYVIMLLVAGFGFASNFQKQKSRQYGMLGISIIALVTYCYMGYMRQSAESIFAVFPLLAVLITPILGSYVDHKGKAASMLILGSLLLIACHLTFAFILPLFKESAVGGIIIAYATILVLGSSKTKIMMKNTTINRISRKRLIKNYSVSKKMPPILSFAKRKILR